MFEIYGLSSRNVAALKQMLRRIRYMFCPPTKLKINGRFLIQIKIGSGDMKAILFFARFFDLTSKQGSHYEASRE